MGCGNKVEHNCGSVLYATCTKYEGGVSDSSSLVSQCRSVENTTQDIYNQLDVIDEKIDLSSLENDCITFSEPKTLLSVLTQLLSKLCNTEALVEEQAGLITTLQAQVAALQANPCN